MPCIGLACDASELDRLRLITEIISQSLPSAVTWKCACRSSGCCTMTISSISLAMAQLEMVLVIVFIVWVFRLRNIRPQSMILKFRRRENLDDVCFVLFVERGLLMASYNGWRRIILRQMAQSLESAGKSGWALPFRSYVNGLLPQCLSEST